MTFKLLSKERIGLSQLVRGTGQSRDHGTCEGSEEGENVVGELKES